MQDKTYNKTCVIIKDSDQPKHPLSMARVLIYPSLVSPKAREGQATSKDSHQTAQMRSLIWVFDGPTSLSVSFVVR